MRDVARTFSLAWNAIEPQGINRAWVYRVRGFRVRGYRPRRRPPLFLLLEQEQGKRAVGRRALRPAPSFLAFRPNFKEGAARIIAVYVT